MTSTERRLSLIRSPKLKVLEFPFIRQDGRRSRLQNWGLVLTSTMAYSQVGLNIPISFVGVRSSTQPTCQPFCCCQRNQTKWPKMESPPKFTWCIVWVLVLSDPLNSLSSGDIESRGVLRSDTYLDLVFGCETPRPS